MDLREKVMCLKEVLIDEMYQVIDKNYVDSDKSKSNESEKNYRIC
jgi:hypothetical protein